MQKPDRSKLKYNTAKLKEAAKRPQLPYAVGQDWYPFVIVAAEEMIGETDKTRGDMIVACQCAAVCDIARVGDVTARLRPLMRERFTVPLANPDFPGHEAPEYSYGLTEGFLLAVYDEDELPRPPRREVKGGPLQYKGKEIAAEAEDEARLEVMTISANLAEDLYFGCEAKKSKVKGITRALSVNDLKGRYFLGQVGADRKGEGYTNILNRRHVDRGLPDGGGWGPAYTAGKPGSQKAPPKRKARAKKGSAQ